MSKNILWKLAAAGALAGGALAFGAPAGAAPPSGSYSGSSSDGIAVYLVVTGSQVEFGTGLNRPAGCPFGGVSEGGTPPGGVTLQGSSFSFMGGGLTAVSLSGTIDEDGNASGTISFFDAANPECDVSGTWSATLPGGGSTTTAPTTTAPTTTAPTTTAPTTTAPTTTAPSTTTGPATSGPATSAPATSAAPGSTAPAAAGPIVSDSTPQAGQQVTVSAPGFQAGESVAVTLESTPRSLGTVTADAAGVATVTFTIEADDPVGNHEVVFDGAVSPTVRVPIEIVAAPAAASLPATL